MAQNRRSRVESSARIGRYRLIGRLARGGMAEAHLALWGDLPGLRKLVVVKRILPHLASNDDFVRMFFDEARISALLDHPNIPRVIEVGHDQDGYFLAMEAVSGKPLSALLRRARRRERPLGQAHAAFIVARAAAGLGYAHALTAADGRPLNIVHRDVSPENILVSFEGAVKLIDFGIARAQGRLSETLVGGLKGKVQYMSPEQASGEPVDRRSDVFSLGVVLWEALSGRRLFHRENDLAVLRAITEEPIPRPSGPLPIPGRLEEIVMTALEKAPEDRFQDAHEMALLLERHAFRTDEFDPAELAAQVKQLFPADCAGWTATLAMAQGVEGRGRREITATFPFLGSIDGGTSNAAPTLALHKPGPRDDAATEADPGPSYPMEPPLELSYPSSPALTSWDGADPEHDSDSGAPPSLPGDAAAASLGQAPVLPRRRLSAPIWLLAGAVASATLFVAVRGRKAAPAADPPLAQTLPSVRQTSPQIEMLVTTPAPTPTPALVSPPASVPAGPQLLPPDHVRVVKAPARKRPRKQRAHSLAKPRAPRAPGSAAEPPPTAAPAKRPAWSDPFE